MSEEMRRDENVLLMEKMSESLVEISEHLLVCWKSLDRILRLVRFQKQRFLEQQLGAAMTGLRPIAVCDYAVAVDIVNQAAKRCCVWRKGQVPLTFAVQLVMGRFCSAALTIKVPFALSLDLRLWHQVPADMKKDCSSLLSVMTI